MTDLLFFDCDCISAFLWVKNESLLAKLYPGRIVIPKPVYNELSYPGVTHLRERIDSLVRLGQARIEAISTGTKAYALYYQLTEVPKGNRVIIGKGEAASIVLAKLYDGIVASNNLRDTSFYVRELGLRQVTTGDILVEAFDGGHITEDEGNAIWALMLAKRRRLGATSFKNYLQSTQR